jgi:uncharacterized protein
MHRDGKTVAMNDPVPSFPEFRKIVLSDKELFGSYYSRNPQETSEQTFTNFFIWRNCDRSQMTLINGNICVMASPENEAPYFFEPLGENNLEGTIKACLSHVPRFSRVSEKFMKANFEGRKNFNIALARDHFDYLYRTQDLIALKGRRYDGKRNKIKRFLKNNIPICQELTADAVPDCLRLLDKWGKSKADGVCFDEPIREALKHFSALNVKGAVVKISGKVEAFTIGEKLNRDSAVVYIEVANLDIDGLSQYINQQFCRNEWSDTEFINREEDLGDEGLRMAKLSYQPINLINKFDITLTP